MLVARRVVEPGKGKAKLSAQWIGPGEVTKVYPDGFRYDVKLDNKILTRHISRLKRFATKAEIGSKYNLGLLRDLHLGKEQFRK